MRHAVVRAVAATIFLLGTVSAYGQAAAPDAPAVQPFVRNWTRFEMWNYFQPPPQTPNFTPGDPTTAHVGNRLQAGLRIRRGKVDATVALQYVQFGGLPADAFGPGLLGTGATYFDHSGDTASHQVFLKAAHVAFRQVGAFDVQLGRMPFTSGAERASGVPKIEAVKRQRIDSRLVGEFEWAIYQRAYDGARIDWRGPRVQVTATAFQPTQGGYEDAAGVSMRDVRVFSGIVTTQPGLLVPRSEVQLFAHRYVDDRAVTVRPDATGVRAARADVGITTLGGHLVGARPAGAGEFDVMLWGAGQFGSWYQQDHRAAAIAAEAGYQLSRARWTPWVRGGVSWFSGDGSPSDGTHGTFFPMLPTIRRYSQSTLYSMANLRDVSAQLMLRPTPAINARVDLHVLVLASRADGWYSGSGATQNNGRIFGYALRPSGGQSRLMEVVEGSVDWRIDPRWSINGYLGVASRGPVVRTSFASGSAVFCYLENVVQF